MAGGKKAAGGGKWGGGGGGGGGGRGWGGGAGGGGPPGGAGVGRCGGCALIEVADRGPGIPEADRVSVFDRFVRLEPSRSTPGNGLGLSLVRAVARRHGGTVTLTDNQSGIGQSRIGHSEFSLPGLTVQIEIPLCASAI